MSLVDALAKIESLKVRFLTGKANILSNNTLFKYEKIDNSRHIHITAEDYKKLKENPSQLQELKSSIQEYIAAGGDYAFSDTVNASNISKVTDIIYDSSKRNSLEFIHKVIPKADQALWISALALRSATKMEEIKRIKADMVASAGHRGANIANLCRANYLETKIIPLYNKFFELPNGLQLFLESYARIVNYPVFAVFVSEGQIEDDILEEIRTKVSILLKDGEQYQYKIDIHGINLINVLKIKRILPTILEEYSDQIEQQVVRGSEKFGFIDVEITFKATSKT